MKQFRYDGQVFPLVPYDDPTFDETILLEQLLATPASEWTQAQETRAMLWLSVRRIDADLLTWDAMGRKRLKDFELIGDDEDDEPGEDDGDPPAGAGDESADGPGTG